MKQGALIVVLGFISTFFLVSIFRKFAHRLYLLDIPNARSSHDQPVPRGGGVGFVLSFFLGVVCLYYLRAVDHKILIASVGGLFIAAVGLWDDFGHVPARVRIFIHFFVAIWVLRLFHGMPPLELGFTVFHWHVLGSIVGVLGLVWLINLYNFMDGIDGLAGGEAVFVASASALILFLIGQSQYLTVLLLLAACVAGFLIWNWSPAHIFMGDAGSGFLGYIFGVLLIATVAEGTFTPWQWLILFGCFWVDATLTLFSRILRKEAVYQAHCSHAFQRAVRLTGCHKHVVVNVLIINIVWLFPLAILSMCYPHYVLLITTIAILPVIILCLFLKPGISTDTNNDFLDIVVE